MMRFFTSLLLLALLTGSVPLIAQDDDAAAKPSNFKPVPGTYELKWDPELTSSFLCVQEPWDASLIKKEPTLVSTYPDKQLFRIDSRKDSDMVAVILDESKGTGKGYDIAYVDSNRNGDLSDDKPVKIQKSADVYQFYQIYTDWVEIPSHQGALSGENTSHPIKVRYLLKTEPGFMGLQKMGGWKGTIDTDHGKQECAVIDANSNGIFGDRVVDENNYSDHLLIDVFLLDPNTQRSIYATFGTNQAIQLYDICRFQGELYTFKVNEIGTRLTIAPYTGKTGKIKITADDINRLKAKVRSGEMRGQSGCFRLMQADHGEMVVPVGKYQTKLTLKMEPEDLFLSCNLTKDAIVEESKTTEIKIAGEVTASIIPLGDNTGGSSYATVDFHIDIGDTATIESVEDSDGNLRTKARFLDSNNKPVHETYTSLTSGTKDGIMHTFNIPKLKPGKYTLQLTLDTKSKFGVIQAKRTLAIEEDSE